MKPLARGIRQSWPFAEPPLKVQEAALAACAGAYRYGYFLDMGLGKTRLILAEAENLLGAGEIRNLAICLPNSLKSTWQIEAEKVGSSFEIVVWPKVPPLKPERCCFLINFEAVIATGGKALERFLEAGDCMLVLDESARVKNPKAKTTKALLGLSRLARYIRLLSGLPAPQSLLDYWSQLKLLGAAVSRTWVPFRMRYCVMGGFEGREIVGSQNEGELAELIESVSFRARKADWLDLPPKMYTARDYTLTREQRRAYGQMLKEFIIQLEDGGVVAAPLAVTQLTKLSQISSGFVLDGGEAIDLVPPADNPKLAVLGEILEETAGKVIVFAVFRHSLEMLRQRYPDCPAIEGGMKPEEIASAVETFNSGQCKAIFCQVSSAKYGITLLGHKGMPCSTVVYVENSYSLDSRAQSEDRAHRMGQTRSVLYVDILGTKVERAALEILSRKLDLSAAILDRKSSLRQAIEQEAR